MSKNATARDLQRNDFIENLYRSLRKKTKQALASREKWIKTATQYIEDGMEKDECVELLMIDGLSKEAASAYVDMAIEESEHGDADIEYSFQFEDSFGRIWSSSDIGKFVKASNDEDAWARSEELIFSEAEEYNPEKLISVNKISE